MEFERRGDEAYGEKYSRCAERKGINYTTRGIEKVEEEGEGRIRMRRTRAEDKKGS